MTATVKLTDGTTIVDLTDTTAYLIQNDGITLEPADISAISRPASPYANGVRPAAYVRGNSLISVRLHIKGATHDAMVANINALEDMLRKARLAQADTAWPKVTFEFKERDSTSSVFYHIVDGKVSPGDGVWGIALNNASTLLDAILDLEAYGSPYGETRMLCNYAANSWMNRDNDSDGVADSWTSSTGAGGTATYSIDGGQKIAITGNSSGGTAVCQVTQEAVTSGLAVSDVWSAKCRMEIGTATNFSGALALQFLGAGGTILGGGGTTAFTTAGTTAWSTVSVSGTVPASAGTIQMACMARSHANGAAGTAWFKDVQLEKAGAISDEWISSCALINHSDSGTAHYNYIDIEGVLGNVAAPAGAFVLNTGAHNVGTIWLANRSKPTLSNFDWWLDSEDSLLVDIDSTYAADAATSAGGVRAGTISGSGTTKTMARFDLATNWSSYRGKYRVLAIVNQSGTTAADFSWQQKTQWREALARNDLSAGQWVPSAAVSANGWELLDLGPVFWPPMAIPTGLTATSDILSLVIMCKRNVAGTAVARLDAVALLPVDEGWMYARYEHDGAGWPNGAITLDGMADPPMAFEGSLQNFSFGVNNEGELYLQPGDNKLHAIWCESPGAVRVTIGDSILVQLQYRPTWETLR